MNTTTEVKAACCQPRQLLKSSGAVLAGFVSIFVLSLGTDQLFHVLGVYPPWGQPMLDVGLCVLALSYRVVFGVVGAYLTARLAPHAPMCHAIVLGGLGTVLSALGTIAMWNMGPNWYPILLTASALPTSWLGAKLFLRK